MQRYIVHWEVAIIAEQDGKKTIHYGHTHDLSLEDANIFSAENLNFKTPVMLEIRIPKGKSIKEWRQIEIKCARAVSVAEDDYFRTPLTFVSYTGDGKQILEAALKERGAMMSAE